MAYVIERESRSGARYVGIYPAADGKYKSAGTYDSHGRAYEVDEDDERHARGRPPDIRRPRPRSLAPISNDHRYRAASVGHP